METGRRHEVQRSLRLSTRPGSGCVVDDEYHAFLSCVVLWSYPYTESIFSSSVRHAVLVVSSMVSAPLPGICLEHMNVCYLVSKRGRYFDVFLDVFNQNAPVGPRAWNLYQCGCIQLHLLHAQACLRLLITEVCCFLWLQTVSLEGASNLTSFVQSLATLW
jgi:hypothetical protein